MITYAKPRHPKVADMSRPADDDLSPEAREELEFFRRMAKVARRASSEELKRLIKPAE